MSSSMRDWLRLPSRIALLLGLGALSAAGAGTEAAVAAPVRVPPQSVKSLGDLLIWQDGGRIFISEAGKAAEELRLGDTAEADRLRQLLAREGATAAMPHALRDRVILVGAGGAGLHWETQRPDDPNKPHSAATHTPDKLAPGTAKAGDRVGAAQPPGRANSDSK